MNLIEEGGVFWTASGKENVIYVVLNESGMVFSYNICTEQWIVQGKIFQDEELQYNFYEQSLYADNKHLYFFQQKGGEFLSYNICSRICKKIRIGKDEFYNSKLASVIEIENKYVFVPFHGKKIGVWNKVSQSFEFYSEWYKELLKKLEVLGLEFNFIKKKSFCLVGKSLYLIANCNEKDIIISLQLTNFRLEEVFVINYPGVFWGMEHAESKIWIQHRTNEGKKIVCWSLEEKKIVMETEILAKEASTRLNWKSVGTRLYVSSFYKDGKSQLLVIDKISGEIIECIDNIFFHDMIVCKDNIIIFAYSEDKSKFSNISDKNMRLCYLSFMQMFENLFENNQNNVNERYRILKDSTVGKLIYTKMKMAN